MTEQLREQLDQATQALKAHMASWEYAFAHGARSNDHPRHAATRARTEELRNQVKDLQARLAEHEL
jgi:glucuronate isomerase